MDAGPPKIGKQGKRTARKARGLEAALLDWALMDGRPLGGPTIVSYRDQGGEPSIDPPKACGDPKLGSALIDAGS
jgi:hypothetical protein